MLMFIESIANVPASVAKVGTSVELFTGCGGLALATRDAGFRGLLAVERDKWACETLLANVADEFASGFLDPVAVGGRWPLVAGDVRTVDFSRLAGVVDLVAAGVPCQPWSLGGIHCGHRDPRDLWPELIRCVRQTRPRAVIAENVRGMLRSSFRPYYDYILRSLAAPFEAKRGNEDWREHDERLRSILARPSASQSERYDVTYWLVNAADYGVPQVRWRVFVVAFRSDLGCAGWVFPQPTHSEAALLRSMGSGEYWDRHGLVTRGADAPCLLPVREQTAPWRTLRDAIGDLPEPIDGEESPGWLHHRGWPGAREYRGHTPNELDRPAKTVKAGVHGVPGGECVVRLDDGALRHLTVREVARVMTFPDDWWLAGSISVQIRQLGNAVPVMLGRAATGSVAATLGARKELASRCAVP